MRNKLRIKGPLRDYLEEVLNQLRSRLGGDLVSVILFGSFGRGEAGEGSDIDLLVVSENFKESFGGRFDLFNEIERQLISSGARRRLRELGFGTLISPVPLAPEEVERNPPILLDILTDGVILYDRDEFMGNHLGKLKHRLEVLGAKKVYLPSGRWYWDLKPGYKLGESVEI